MSGAWLPWNDGASPRVCHCESCDAPNEPACDICKADDVETDEWGLCEMCRPTDDENCEAWEERTAKRGPQ